MQTPSGKHRKKSEEETAVRIAFSYDPGQEFGGLLLEIDEDAFQVVLEALDARHTSNSMVLATALRLGRQGAIMGREANPNGSRPIVQ